ncbi:BA14K family protein [Pseudaminobacter sp. 19-2017]|uniref:Lectin-like protein BA14k n=2 Tax=Pseudaminobacter soli (ex Zhang et al. 2022) TaxID=2831468 RepID=A0A942I4P1_9HYPH|nr:BA14K family protein [Pseudaminobacter soli]
MGGGGGGMGGGGGGGGGTGGGGGGGGGGGMFPQGGGAFYRQGIGYGDYYSGYSAHVARCAAHHRSYRASDNTFQPLHGPRRQCISP